MHLSEEGGMVKKSGEHARKALAALGRVFNKGGKSGGCMGSAAGGGSGGGKANGDEGKSREVDAVLGGEAGSFIHFRGAGPNPSRVLLASRQPCSTVLRCQQPRTN